MIDSFHPTLQACQNAAFDILGQHSNFNLHLEQFWHKELNTHLSLQDSWIVAPEKGNNYAFSALSAICTNLRKEKTALLARFLPRVNGDISIGFMTPCPGSRPGAQACLIMNVLPFEADLRQASFTAFSQNPDLLPHKDQTAAVEDLIEAFSLVEGMLLSLQWVSLDNAAQGALSLGFAFGVCLGQSHCSLRTRRACQGGGHSIASLYMVCP